MVHWMSVNTCQLQRNTSSKNIGLSVAFYPRTVVSFLSELQVWIQCPCKEGRSPIHIYCAHISGCNGTQITPCSNQRKQSLINFGFWPCSSLTDPLCLRLNSLLSQEICSEIPSCNFRWKRSVALTREIPAGKSRIVKLNGIKCILTLFL